MSLFLVEGLEIGEHCSDFVAVKTDGDLRVRECTQKAFKKAHDRQTVGCFKELLETAGSGRLEHCYGEEGDR